MLRKAILSGTSPFWIEEEYCGHPSLLVQEAPLFYPMTVPLLATGGAAHRLTDLFSLFHFWLAGFAAFLLLSDLKAGTSAAAFGGVAWMLSARLVQSALWPNSVAVSALLPLLLLGVLRIGRGLRRSGVLWTAVAGGLSLLAFRPQVLVAASPVLVAVAVASIAGSPARGRALRDLAVSAALALALGAPALLPSAALYPSSSRVGGLSREERDIRPITFDRDLDQVFLPVDGIPRWPEAAAYPGVLAGLLFLAGIGYAVRRDPGFPRSLFLALAIGGAIGLVFAFGEKGPYGLVAGLPVFRDFRIPARFLVSWSLGLALASALAAARAFDRSRRPAWLGAAGVVLLAADLAWHARRAAPTAPSEVYAAEPMLAAEVRERLSPDVVGFPRRFWSLAPPFNLLDHTDLEKPAAARQREPLSFAIGMRYGLESVLGQGPTLLRSSVLFATPSRRAAELGGVGVFVLPEPRASAFATEALAAGRPPYRIEGFAPLPRAVLVPEAAATPASRAVAATLDPAFDPRKIALLEGSEGFERDPAWDEAAASVRLLAREPGRFELEASLPARGVLVVFNSFEKGWRATIDGDPVPILRADAAFLGVPLAAGRHRVRFEYRPRGLKEGLGVAAAGILGLVLAAMKLPAGEGSPV